MNRLDVSAGRPWLRRAGVAATAVGAAIALAAPAMAGQAPAATPTATTRTLPGGTVVEKMTMPTGTTTAHFAVGSARATVTNASPNTTPITCELYYKVPYSVVSGGTWVIATNWVRCDRPVALIHLLVALLENGRTVNQDVRTAPNSASTSAYVQSPCNHDAQYQTGNYTMVIAPPGGVPPTWTAQQDSYVRVVC